MAHKQYMLTYSDGSQDRWFASSPDGAKRVAESCGRCVVSVEQIGSENAPPMPVQYDDTLSRRQEKLALIRLLRDETNSKSVFDRCVALVGEQ